MTPDELRKLADEATSEMNAAGQIMTEASGESWLRLIALAPDLARLCAELGEALAAIQTHTRFSEMADGEVRIMQVAAALAMLSALES